MYGVAEGLKGPHKGPKRTAYTKWQTRLKDFESEDEFFDHFEVGYLSDLRNRKAAKRTSDFVPQLPMLVTYLNQYRYECEHETDTSEYLEREKSCHSCACGKPATLWRAYENRPSSPQCEACYLKSVDLSGLREQFKKLGFDSNTTITEMRAKARQLAATVGKIPDRPTISPAPCLSKEESIRQGHKDVYISLLRKDPQQAEAYRLEHLRPQ